MTVAATFEVAQICASHSKPNFERGAIQIELTTLPGNFKLKYTVHLQRLQTFCLSKINNFFSHPPHPCKKDCLRVGWRFSIWLSSAHTPLCLSMPLRYFSLSPTHCLHSCFPMGGSLVFVFTRDSDLIPVNRTAAPGIHLWVPWIQRLLPEFHSEPGALKQWF